MALALRGTPQQSDSSTTVTFPAGIASGDVGLLMLEQGANPTTPTGWTAFTGAPANDGFIFLAAGAYWKILTGSETSFTASASHWSMVVYSGADGTTPVLNQSKATNFSFATSITPGACTNAGGATVFSVLLFADEGSGGATAPSGWTWQTTPSGAGATTGIADNQSPGTGTVTPGAIAQGGGHNSVVWHALIQVPAAAASPLIHTGTGRQAVKRASYF